MPEFRAWGNPVSSASLETPGYYELHVQRCEVSRVTSGRENGQGDTLEWSVLVMPALTPPDNDEDGEWERGPDGRFHTDLVTFVGYLYAKSDEAWGQVQVAALYGTPGLGFVHLDDFERQVSCALRSVSEPLYDHCRRILVSQTSWLDHPLDIPLQGETPHVDVLWAAPFMASPDSQDAS